MKTFICPKCGSKLAPAQATNKIIIREFNHLRDMLNITEEEVLNNAIKLEPVIKGIYFIIQNNKIIYIGQAEDIIRRLRTHHVYKDKCGMKVCIFPIKGSLHDILIIESYYINKFVKQRAKHGCSHSLKTLRDELKRHHIDLDL